MGLVVPSMKAYLAESICQVPKADAILSRAVPKEEKAQSRDGAVDCYLNLGARIQDDEQAGLVPQVVKRRMMEAAEAMVAEDRAFKKRRTAGSSGWTPCASLLLRQPRTSNLLSSMEGRCRG